MCVALKLLVLEDFQFAAVVVNSYMWILHAGREGCETFETLSSFGTDFFKVTPSFSSLLEYLFSKTDIFKEVRAGIVRDWVIHMKRLYWSLIPSTLLTCFVTDKFITVACNFGRLCLYEEHSGMWGFLYTLCTYMCDCPVNQV